MRPGTQAPDTGALSQDLPARQAAGDVAPQQPGHGPVTPQTHGAVLVTPRHGGDEGRVDARHVALLDGRDELLDCGDLVVLEVPQQRRLEARPAVAGAWRTLVTDPES